MSKLALFTLTLLSALIVPNFCQLNDRGHSQDDLVSNSDFYSTMAVIVCLIALYLLSRLFASESEPNVCVYGNFVKFLYSNAMKRF